MPKHALAENLIDKIRELPPDKITEVEDFVDFLRMTSDEILAKHTGQPFEKISEDTERDRFMSSLDAVEYGLIDRMIESH